jgi:hypothetical protein
LNPDRYAIIYNNQHDNNENVFNNNNGTVEAVSYSHFPYLKSHQNHYYNEYREGILQTAKTFLNSLSNQLIDKTMVEAVKT